MKYFHNIRSNELFSISIDTIMKLIPELASFKRSLNGRAWIASPNSSRKGLLDEAARLKNGRHSFVGWRGGQNATCTNASTGKDTRVLLSTALPNEISRGTSGPKAMGSRGGKRDGERLIGIPGHSFNRTNWGDPFLADRNVAESAAANHDLVSLFSFSIGKVSSRPWILARFKDIFRAFFNIPKILKGRRKKIRSLNIVYLEVDTTFVQFSFTLFNAKSRTISNNWNYKAKI